MKKRDTLLTFLLAGVFLLSFASAGWFSDTWNFITGHVTATNQIVNTSYILTNGPAAQVVKNWSISQKEFSELVSPFISEEVKWNVSSSVTSGSEALGPQAFDASKAVLTASVSSSGNVSALATIFSKILFMQGNTYFTWSGSSSSCTGEVDQIKLENGSVINVYSKMSIPNYVRADVGWFRIFTGMVTLSEKNVAQSNIKNSGQVTVEKDSLVWETNYLEEGFCLPVQLTIYSHLKPNNYAEVKQVISSAMWITIPSRVSIKPPTMIYTCQDLQNINKNLFGNYLLANDLDCTDFKFVALGGHGQYDSIPPFSGTLDGGGHVIFNLTTIVSGSFKDPYVGNLFNTISDVEIKNLGLVNPSINIIDAYYTRNDRSYNVGYRGYFGSGPSGSNQFVKISNVFIINSTSNIMAASNDAYVGVWSGCYLFSFVAFSGSIMNLQNIFIKDCSSKATNTNSAVLSKYRSKETYSQLKYISYGTDNQVIDESRSRQYFTNYKYNEDLINFRSVNGSLVQNDSCLENLKNRSSYNSSLWDFKNVWSISPSVNGGYPYLRGFDYFPVTENSCVDKCPVIGIKQCSGESYQTCDYNFEGCLDWSQVQSCESGLSCSEGNCVKNCGDSDWISQINSEVCPSSGQLTKTWNKLSACSGGVSHAASETVSCVYQAPVCVYQYSQYGSCSSNGIKTRTIVSQSPENCEGNPELTDSCTYIPTCTDNNWQSSTENCSVEGKQKLNWEKKGVCEGGVSHASETVSCVYQAPECVYDYSDWSECKPSNTMNCNATLISSGNCEGSPIISQSCKYVPVCVADQTKQCSVKTNALVSGYADKCSSDGSRWTGENTCSYSCKAEFISVLNSCVKEEDKSKVQTQFNETSVDVTPSGNSFMVKDKLNEALIKVSSGVSKLDLVKDTDNGNNFIIVKNLTLTGSEVLKKTIYLKINNQTSNGICFADRDNIQSSDDISNNCTKILCPGSLGDYTCSIEENSFAISGLAHSGVIEAYLFCGDNVCSQEESCLTCSNDCGSCPSSISRGGSRSRPLTFTNNSSTILFEPSSLIQQNLSEEEVKELLESLGDESSISEPTKTIFSLKGILDFLDLSNAPTNEKIKRIFIIIGTVFGALVFLAIIGILINKLVNKIKDKTSSGTENLEKEKIKEINSLIKEARSSLSKNKLTEAKEIYQTLREVYNSLEDKNQEITQKATDLYKDIYSKL